MLYNFFRILQLDSFLLYGTIFYLPNWREYFMKQIAAPRSGSIMQKYRQQLLKRSEETIRNYMFIYYSYNEKLLTKTTVTILPTFLMFLFTLNYYKRELFFKIWRDFFFIQSRFTHFIYFFSFGFMKIKGYEVENGRTFFLRPINNNLIIINVIWHKFYVWT